MPTSGNNHNYGQLQNSAYRTNRYLTMISGDSSGTGSTTSNNNNNTVAAAGGLSKDAKSFQKSLRKPPNGVYLNYDELVELVQTDYHKIFNQLNRRYTHLSKMVTNYGL